MTAVVPVIAVENVSFSFDGVPVLEDVSFTVAPLDSVCVVGPNGGGKTTLVKIILGLLPADTGTVRLFGLPPAAAILRVGYVPQYVHLDLQFPVTVLDVVLMGRLGLHFGGGYRRDDRQLAMAALAEMQLADLARRPFAQLSGGQRQRVLIARALAATSEMLILDEPTAYIDAAAEANLFEKLTELNRRLTVLVVTHDLGFASRFFRSVLCVNRRVVIHPTSEITGELIRDIYGGDIRMIRHDHRCAEEGHQHD
ncbi:MAG: ABC transporter ATP-binding protein [Thermodesulfobacteriota bacterium]